MRPARAPLVVVARRRAGLVVGARRDEVAEAVAAALPGVVERAELTILEHPLTLQRVVRDDRARRLSRAEQSRGRDVGRAARPIQRKGREVGLDLIPLDTHGLVEAAGAESALLRDDLDDPRRRVGAVERRRGWPL